MESGFFIAVLSFIAEVVVFGASVTYLFLARKTTLKRPTLVLSTLLLLLGGLSAAFSYRYAANEWVESATTMHYSWLALFMTSLLQPVVMLLIVGYLSMSRRD